MRAYFQRFLAYKFKFTLVMMVWHKAAQAKKKFTTNLHFGYISKFFIHYNTFIMIK